MKTYTERGTAIGELVERKNAAYGDSITRTGELLRILYPEGLRPEQYDDLALQVRIFDKQMRIATDRDALGESPYEDIAGYGILGADMQQKKKEASARWQGNANGPDAANSSRNGTPDSTPQSASARTGPSATERTAPEPSPQPDGCSEPFPAATAATATDAASLSADDQPVALQMLEALDVSGPRGGVYFHRLPRAMTDPLMVNLMVDHLKSLKHIDTRGHYVWITDLGRASLYASRIAERSYRP